jgi:hypothetical protein
MNVIVVIQIPLSLRLCVLLVIASPTFKNDDSLFLKKASGPITKWSLECSVSTSEGITNNAISNINKIGQ